MGAVSAEITCLHACAGGNGSGFSMAACCRIAAWSSAAGCWAPKGAAQEVAAGPGPVCREACWDV